MNNVKCKICDKYSITHLYDSKNDREAIDCSYCGKYYLVSEFDLDMYSNKSNFYKVSSWIREQNELFSINPNIGDENFDDILELKDKKIKEKFDLMIMFLSHIDSNHISKEVYDNLLLRSWISGHDELMIVYNKAIEVNYINGSINKQMHPLFNYLTFEGIEYLESLENINKDSKDIFVAFNFDDELKEVFNTNLKAAIDNEGFNYVVVNQNNVEHNKSINDEIIVKLKSSRIVIADFTNHRNSVYFEAGYAMGMNIPIIWTCKKEHENDMSFDTRQFPHIIWNDKDDLVKQVIDRIKVIL